MTAGKGHRRKLTEEETILWHRVGRTVTPLPGKMPELPRVETADFAELLDGKKPEQKKPGPAPAAQPFLPSWSPPPQPVQRTDRWIDKPTHKKLSKGRLAIDARIDLHAMTQDQAHDRLFAFLADARAYGARHVLVVTGKGSSLGSEGVLKRMVPVWLNNPRFSALVSGYAEASRHHGGEGAIYIRLRKAAQDGSGRP